MKTLRIYGSSASLVEIDDEPHLLLPNGALVKLPTGEKAITEGNQLKVFDTKIGYEVFDHQRVYILQKGSGMYVLVYHDSALKDNLAQQGPEFVLTFMEEIFGDDNIILSSSGQCLVLRGSLQVGKISNLGSIIPYEVNPKRDSR